MTSQNYSKRIKELVQEGSKNLTHLTYSPNSKEIISRIPKVKELVQEGSKTLVKKTYSPKI